MDKTQLLTGFNVRVYGLLLHQESLLVSWEKHGATSLLKLPGGGIEHGESPEEALIREFQEEVGVDIHLGEFFHVSKKFQLSYFRPMQLIALYWRVSLAPGQSVPQAHSSLQPLETEGHFYQLKWAPLAQLKVGEFTALFDREMAQKILSEESPHASFASKEN